MQIVSSYGVEIKKKEYTGSAATLDIFRKAVSYLIPVYAGTWEELSEIRNPQKRFNAAEHLVHETKKNPARFAFDPAFLKMPSYPEKGLATNTHLEQCPPIKHVSVCGKRES